MWAFNAEVTISPKVAPPPCSYGWPTVLVLFLGMPWKAAFNGMLLFFLMILVGPVLGDVSWQFGLSLFILRRFFLLDIGLGLCIKWAGVAEFFDHTRI